MIYCGTFSKTLAPALRIGFAIVPAPLVPAFVRLRTLTDRGTDAFTQATLAEFMRLGLLAPHIRKMRTEYGRRRDALLEAMARVVRHASPLAAPGGLHMVARLPDGVDEAAAVRACRARDLAVSPLRAYYAGEPRMTGLVIGFAATPVAMAAGGGAAAGGGLGLRALTVLRVPSAQQAAKDAPDIDTAAGPRSLPPVAGLADGAQSPRPGS